MEKKQVQTPQIGGNLAPRYTYRWMLMAFLSLVPIDMTLLKYCLLQTESLQWGEKEGQEKDLKLFKAIVVMTDNLIATLCAAEE